MNIGLLGYGTVGKGVYELLQTRSDCRISRLLYRHPLQLPGVSIHADFNPILQDDTIDTIVEVIGGLHPAYDYVRAAILAGKNVVTANKALIAAYYDELIPLAQKMGVKLRCTAAVGGGIGWLSNLERARRCQQITEVGGIMNGTCNYILDAMTRLGLSYEEALSQAQALGYAEADPSADVEGFDTWNKLIISANVAFGIRLDAALTPVAGIHHIRATDIAQFRAHGLVCKLIATARQTGNGCSAWVQPTLVSANQLEAAVSANDNLISLMGSVTGKQSFFGQGAGRYPTAYNVVQDCLDLLDGNGFYCPYGKTVAICNDKKLRYYVRGGQDLPCRIDAHWGDAAITEPVSVHTIHQWLAQNPTAFLATLPEE